MQNVLLIDFGSTYTKVAVVDVESEAILGTARVFTTVDTDINEGLDRALDIFTGKGPESWNTAVDLPAAALREA